MPLSELDKLLLGETEPELSGLDKLLLGEAPTITEPVEEPTWWGEAWEATKERAKPIEPMRIYYDENDNELFREVVDTPLENRYKGDYFKSKITTPPSLLGVAEKILPQPSPEFKEKYYLPTVMSVIKTKINNNEVLTQDELDTVHTFMAGHTNRPPGYTAEQWRAVPEGWQKFYNYATTAAIIAGVTAPIWTHPSFVRGVKFGLKTMFGKTPPRKIVVPTGAQGLGKKAPPGVPTTKVIREPKLGAPSTALEIEAGKYAIRWTGAEIIRPVKNLTVKTNLDKQILNMIKVIKAERNLNINPITEANKIIEYTNRHYPSDLTMMLKPEFINSTIDLINNDLQQILPGVMEAGITVVPKTEAPIEEEVIATREEAKPLEEVSPYGEKFVAPEPEARPTVMPEVAPKGVFPVSQELYDIEEIAERVAPSGEQDLLRKESVTPYDIAMQDRWREHMGRLQYKDTFDASGRLVHA